MGDEGTARQALTAGKSTRDDVIAALGKTTVVKFDSGFEVWVYRTKGSEKTTPGEAAPGRTELVVLFAPSGVVTKTRIRPPAREVGQ